jgi:hypothetical protein
MRDRRVFPVNMALLGRVVAVGCLAVAATVAAPSGAQAAAPNHGSFSNTETFVDTEVCAPEGFAVNVTQTESGFFTLFFDADGDFVRAVVHMNYDATISANGHTIVERDRWQTIFYADGSWREAGLTVHVQGPRIVQLDAGQIAFNPDGSVAYLHGPHPQFLGQTWCSALLP